eukprot:2951002-Amphidinium_carterae.2
MPTANHSKQIDQNFEIVSRGGGCICTYFLARKPPMRHTQCKKGREGWVPQPAPSSTGSSTVGSTGSWSSNSHPLAS